MSRTADKSALILLARLDSNRLPGKGLMDLCGRPVLGRAIDRLRKCTAVQNLIIATSDRPVDDALAEFAASEGIKLFRGDVNDVAGRCLACCNEFNLDWFIRICGDSPYVAPDVVDQVALTYMNTDCEIATNVFPRGYPIGTSAEAVGRDAMQRICDETKDLKYLEHVTAYAYQHPEKFVINSIRPFKQGFADFSIAVDTIKELENMRWLTTQLDDPANASMDRILELAQQRELDRA